MAYADYEFYQNTYHGNVVPDSYSFGRIAERASDQIDIMTNDRLADDMSWLNERQIVKVKKACCALTESIYQSESIAKSGMEQVGTVDGKGKVISSVSSGSESVSYATGGASANSLEGQAVQQMIADSKKRAIDYLSGILYKNSGYSILFRGIGYE